MYEEENLAPIAALPNKILNINQNENTNLNHPLIKNIIDKVLGQTVNRTSKWSGLPLLIGSGLTHSLHTLTHIQSLLTQKPRWNSLRPSLARGRHCIQLTPEMRQKLKEGKSH